MMGEGACSILRRGRLGEGGLKEEGAEQQSTAEHGKAPFIERRGGYVQYTNPYHPYREAEDSRAQQGSVEKGGKERGRNEEVDWISYNSTAQHS